MRRDSKGILPSPDTTDERHRCDVRPRLGTAPGARQLRALDGGEPPAAEHRAGSEGGVGCDPDQGRAGSGAGRRDVPGRVDAVSRTAVPRMAVSLAVASLAVGGCGGAKMQRTDGAHRYRPLPLGTLVRVVAREQQLGSRYAVIGTLRWLLRTGRETPDTSEAEAELKKTAAKFGCDAVLGLEVRSEARKSTRKVATVGEGGKRVYRTRETTTWYHTFTARCVRTDKAPGGLVGGSGRTAKLIAAARPPLLSAGDKATARSASARPIDPAAEALWDRLSPHGSTLLKSWKDALRKPPEDEMQVLEALGELMVQVSGPAGFWRKTVRTEWFGCPTDPDQEQCKKLDAALKGFGPWERLRESVGRQRPGSARAFIRAQRSRIGRYFNELVPRAPNLTGMQQTGLYMTKLR